MKHYEELKCGKTVVVTAEKSITALDFKLQHAELARL